MTQKTDETTKSKLPWVLGCLGAGCLLPIILVVVGSIGIGIYSKGFVSTEAIVEVAPEAPEKVAQVERKIKDYQSTLNTNEEPKPLAITHDEINVLAAKHLSSSQDQMRVKVRGFEGNMIIADFSAALPNSNPVQWFNGTVKAEVSIREGVLDYEIVDLSTPKRDVPEIALEALKPEIENQLNNQGIRSELNKIKSLTIENGEIQIQLKPTSVE